MGILTAECDDCGIVLEESEIFEDYNSSMRCKICHIKNQIWEKENEVKNNLEWLEKTHLKSIRGFKEEIAELKKELKALE